MERFDEKIMYFIGVSTQQSIINKIFPKWMSALNYNVQLHGIDIPLNAPAGVYHEYAERIKNSDDILGALVTTHKIPMYSYAAKVFDNLTDSAQEFKEIGAIYKRNGQMNGEATDIISVDSAFKSIFKKVDVSAIDLCILGCGGAGVALGYIALRHHSKDLARIVMTDIDRGRLEQAKSILRLYDIDHKMQFVHVGSVKENDKVIDSLRDKSFVVNATGVGKDKPGAPVSSDVCFPFGGCIWEYNYRGKLEFIEIAKRQVEKRQLYIYNGFEYFIYGWTTVISRVLNIDISKKTFEKFVNIAYSCMNGEK